MSAVFPFTYRRLRRPIAKRPLNFKLYTYIIPPIPPAGIAGAGCSSG